MSSCTVFVFLSLIEYAFVNVMMGDISDVERKDKTGHLRNIIVSANSNMPYAFAQQKPAQQQQQNAQNKAVILFFVAKLECFCLKSFMYI
jgi:hypothetical protein